MYKEIDNLLEESRKGNNLSKEMLISKLYPLVVSSIQRYYNRSNEFQDLISEGNLVILECINSYDENRGVYFLGYIKTMLKYHYLNKHKERVHLSLNIPMDEDNGDEWVDLLESHEDGPLELILKSSQRELAIELLSILTNRQREVVVAFYLEELSIGDIAKRLGVTYRTVVNTKTKAIEKMRKRVYTKTVEGFKIRI